MLRGVLFSVTRPCGYASNCRCLGGGGVLCSSRKKHLEWWLYRILWLDRRQENCEVINKDLSVGGSICILENLEINHPVFVISVLLGSTKMAVVCSQLLLMQKSFSVFNC